MVLEVAILNVISGKGKEFERNFKKAQELVSTIEGYISHELRKNVKKQDQYILLIRWEKIEDHINGFRKSPQYQAWKKLLHHFYQPFPAVEYYEEVDL